MAEIAKLLYQTTQEHHTLDYAARYNVFRELTDWNSRTHRLSWKQLLIINPGIIQPFQHWRHHHRATAAGTTLPCKLSRQCAHELFRIQLRYTVLAVIKRDRGYCCSVGISLCCFSTSDRAVAMSQ